MKKKIIFIALLIVFIAFFTIGIINGDLGYIKAFGKFLCLDCIGIS